MSDVKARRWVGVWVAVAAAWGSAAAQTTRPATGARELVARLVGENLERSFEMHVFRETAATRAADALVRMGEAAVPALGEAMGSKDLTQRLNAVYVLGRIRKPGAMAALIGAMSDGSPEVQGMAVGWLPVWTDAKARMAAIRALKDGEVAVRCKTLWVFGAGLRGMGPEKRPGNSERFDVARAIVPLLDDPATRAPAAETLGDVGMNVAALPLLKALADDREPVRRAILEALGKLHDKQVTMGVITYLKDERPQVRAWAAGALGEIGDIRAVPALIQAMADKVPAVRAAAAWALGKIGDRRGVAPLMASLKDEAPAIREVAARSLGQIGDAAALEPLAAMASAGGPGAEAAAWALGQLRDPRGIPALRAYLMAHPESREAADALARIPHPDSVAALVAVILERRSLACRRAIEPLIGHRLDHMAAEEIERWWTANRTSYFPDPPAP